MGQRVNKSSRISQKIREAERLSKRNSIPKPKRKWQKVNCPSCGYKVEYEPKPNWDGKIYCPHCGHNFKIALLSDDWTRKEEVKEMTKTEPELVESVKEPIAGETEKPSTSSVEVEAQVEEITKKDVGSAEILDVSSDVGKAKTEVVKPHPKWSPLVTGKTTITLDQIESALLKIPDMFEITDKNPKENCFPYAVGPRKSVLWIYPHAKKTQAKIIIGHINSSGKVGKTVGLVDEKGVITIEDKKLKISELVKRIKKFIHDRKWDA